MDATLESKLDDIGPVVNVDTLHYLSLGRISDPLLEADYLPEPPHSFLDIIVNYFSPFPHVASDFLDQAMEYVKPVIDALSNIYGFFSRDVTELEDELAEEMGQEEQAFRPPEYLDPEEQLWDFYFRIIKQLPESMIPNIYT